MLGPAGTNASGTSFVLDYFSDLRVSMTNSANPVTVGSNLVYTITIANSGPAAAPNVAVTNLLPATTTLRSATMAPPWVLTTYGNVLVARNSSLDVSGSGILSVSVIPNTIGNLTNRASATSGFPDPATNDNTCSIVNTVEPLPLLSAALTANHIQLSWPAALSNFTLQYREHHPANSGWSVVPIQPIIKGNLRVLTDTNDRPGRFYRLRR